MPTDRLRQSRIYGQPQAPAILLQAAHCLWAEHFVFPSRNPILVFGYWLDTKSDPDKKILYVVQYTSSERWDGCVYTIFIEQRDERQVFNIQNDAAFVSSEKGVKLDDGLLSGNWKRKDLVSAIERIEREPRFGIEWKFELRGAPNVQCKSYTELGNRYYY